MTGVKISMYLSEMWKKTSLAHQSGSEKHLMIFRVIFTYTSGNLYIRKENEKYSPSNGHFNKFPPTSPSS